MRSCYNIIPSYNGKNITRLLLYRHTEFGTSRLYLQDKLKNVDAQEYVVSGNKEETVCSAEGGRFHGNGHSVEKNGSHDGYIEDLTLRK